jgi:hypothetical protein
LVSQPSFGIPYHFGVAVRDLDSSMALYRQVLGVGRWAVRESDLTVIYRGRPIRHITRWSMVRFGSAYLELVEPISGDSPASEFLRARGEGVYHVGYFTEGIDELGPEYDVMFDVRDHGARSAVYLDTFKKLGLYVELVRASRRDEFERWVAASGASATE